MSNFVSQPLDKLLNAQNILKRIEKLEALTGARQSLKVTDLASIANVMTGVRYYAVDPVARVVRFIMSGNDLYDEFGVHAHLLGLNDTGVPQFYVDAQTGAATAGPVTLNADGAQIIVTSSYEDARSYKFALNGSIVSALKAAADSSLNLLTLIANPKSGADTYLTIASNAPAGKNSNLILTSSVGAATPATIYLSDNPLYILLNSDSSDCDTIINGIASAIATFDAGLGAVGFGGAAESGYIAKFTGNVKMINDVQIGASSTDTLTVPATTNFINDVNIGSSAADALTVPATASFNNDVTLGSSAADACNINSDIIFPTAGGGLAYGGCYGLEINQSQVCAQNTWYVVSDTDMTDTQFNNTTHDGTGKITVTNAGVYLIQWDVTFEANANNKHIHIGIALNGSARNRAQSHIESLTNQEQHMSSSCVLAMTAGQYIQICFRTTDTGTPTVLIDDVNLTLVQVGG